MLILTAIHILKSYIFGEALCSYGTVYLGRFKGGRMFGNDSNINRISNLLIRSERSADNVVE